MQAYKSLFLGVLFFCFATSGVCESSEFIGSYSTVSESEWNIEVELKEDGSAILRKITWLAGDYDNKTTVTTHATWTAERSLIKIAYGEIEEYFVFSDKVPLCILGIRGGAPGIAAIDFGYHHPNANAIVGSNILWRMPRVKPFTSPPRERDDRCSRKLE